MNILNRTVLAGLALCSMTFAQSAVAQDQVKSDVITKSLPQPAPLKPISVPTKPAKNKINNTPKSDKKTKDCKYPALVC
ncbi:MAG: hypothetical protein K9J03_03735 [Candidatus Methylopumilus sp.]|jgi:hypothetical protein|nr:hypothetical protein [Candidatus Methylopumilus sp.]